MADKEFEIVVYGATGFTGRLVAEHLARRYGVGQDLAWGMAGRSPEKLAAVRDEIGAPRETPLLVADAADEASLRAMLARTGSVITTVGPYQLYGSPLVAACADMGVDYLDLTGESNWMAEMIAAHHDRAKASGARILLSCGFDSIPFELGVFFTQLVARRRLGAPAQHVRARLRAMQGGLSGGTAASGLATMQAIQRKPELAALMADPFALTPGFRGPEQPSGAEQTFDADIGMEVGPFMMAAINSKNVHRSNFLQDFPYGRDFTYEEMAVITPGAPVNFSDLGRMATLKPGEGPSRSEREAGFYDIAFIGAAADGRKVRAAVKGDMDPGYGSTSKIIAETAICLSRDGKGAAGGVLVPAAALGEALIRRLEAAAGVTFTDETDLAAAA